MRARHRRRPYVAAAGRRRNRAERRLVESGHHDAAGIVAEEFLLAVRPAERHRHVAVRSDADAVDAAVLVPERRQRAVQLRAVVFAVGYEEEQLRRGSIVLLRDLARAPEGRADVRPEQRRRILIDPVEVKPDAVDVRCQIGQHD